MGLSTGATAVATPCATKDPDMRGREGRRRRSQGQQRRLHRLNDNDTHIFQKRRREKNDGVVHTYLLLCSSELEHVVSTLQARSPNFPNPCQLRYDSITVRLY